jgi:hypothetical protein
MTFHPDSFLGWIYVLVLGYGFGCPDTIFDLNPTRCHPFPLGVRTQHLSRVFNIVSVL